MLFDDNTQIEASLGKRFVNLLIDSICIGIVNFVFGFTVGLALTSTGNQAILEDTQANMFLQLFGVGVYFFYYLVFESAFQRTLGKFVTGTKVVMIDGEKPSPQAIALRSLCRFIPFEPLIGLFTTNFWHDSIPKTKVVDI